MIKFGRKFKGEFYHFAVSSAKTAMIDISEALKLIDRETPTSGYERIALTEAVGRVLAEDIIADSDLPPFDRSQMDGFAVVAADTNLAPATLEIVGEAAAGRGWHNTMKSGEAVRIMTGAPIPIGADAVQKVELTIESEGSVRILEPAEKGRSIVRVGSEVKKGAAVFRSGEVISENMIAVLAAFGYAKVRVGRSPRVAILGTGSEIVEITKRPGRDQIRNSNSVMLDVFCRRVGARTEILSIVKDEVGNLKTEIKTASNRVDILILTGGVSVGKYDHTKTALAELDAEIFFEKVRLKPGKPAVFARLGKTLIFGLPGNPVSAAVTFYLLVRKAILIMQGASSTDLRKGNAMLASHAKAATDRDTYLPSLLATDKLGRLIAEPLKWQGSSDFIGFARADSMIFLPRGQAVAAGEVAEVAYL